MIAYVYVIYIWLVYITLVDMHWIVGGRYPVSHYFQPAAGAAMGHGIGHALACLKIELN